MERKRPKATRAAQFLVSYTRQYHVLPALDTPIHKNTKLKINS
jgi:hypothetical protein